MSRFIRFALAAVALALALGSCASQDVKCPTCPPENSARIEVFGVIDLDSVQVSIDGAPRVTVSFLNRHVFGGLSKGAHTLDARVFRTVNFTPEVSNVSLTVRLNEGEARTVAFHHDFGIVVRNVPASDRDRAPLALARRAVRAALTFAHRAG